MPPRLEETVMALGDVYEVALVAQAPEGLVVNVLHVQETVAGIGSPAAQAQDLATAYNTHMATQWKNILPTTYSALAINVAKIWPLPRTVAYTSLTPGAGTRAVTPLPAEVCATITLASNLAGRANRGRMYISGMEQAATLNGNMNLASAYNTALQAFLTKVLTPVTTPLFAFTVNLMIYHRSTHTTVAVATGQVRLPLRAQRRRQYGKGK